MGNQRLAIIDNEGVHLNFSDHLNSSSVTTDSQGNITNLIDYLPYGSDRVNVQLGGFDNRYKFTDKERDNESSLDYFGARYYQASIGRFNQVDPQIMLAVANVLSDPQALNAYAYARNNPIRYIDPTGETFKEFLQGTAKGAWEGVKDLGQGLLQVALNPAIIVTGVANFFGQAANSLDYLVSSYINDPTGTLNQIRDSLSYLVEGWGNLSDEQKGQIIGYALEKTAETYLAARGIQKIGNSTSVETVTKVYNVPQKAFDVLKYVEGKGYKATMEGYSGGKVWENSKNGKPILPEQVQGYYKEWDIDPNVQGVNRGTERLITGQNGEAWYTDDHYTTFTQIK